MKALHRRAIAAGLACSVLSCTLVTAEESKAKPDYVLPAAVGLPDDQLSRLIATRHPQQSVFARFIGLGDADGVEIRKRKFPALSVNGNHLMVTPGTYHALVLCSTPKGDFSGSVKLELTPGRTYTFWCEIGFGRPTTIEFKGESHVDWLGGAAKTST